MIFIANGSSTNGTELTKTETMKAKHISSEVSIYQIDDCYHDIFFPENVDEYSIINTKIQDFLSLQTLRAFLFK